MHARGSEADKRADHAAWCMNSFVHSFIRFVVSSSVLVVEEGIVLLNFDRSLF